MVTKEIIDWIETQVPTMVERRRYLHEHPELSFQETETAKYIQDFYKELGIPFEANVGGNGVVARLEGNQAGKVIALRADFDALPIKEENDLSYKSKNSGVMHACGHDGHTAILLTVAEALHKFKDQLIGTVVFIHQHAEESPPGGAKSIIESHILDDVDAVFGTHLWATTPLGTVETSKDAFMAGSDQFRIVLTGKGGHGGYPHETNDAVVIGTELVSQIHKIVSRRIDPLETAVVTVASFHAGTADNIIANEAVIEGTVRYLNKAIQNQIKEELQRLTEGVCHSYQADFNIKYNEGYPPLINHETEANYILEASEKISGVDHVNEILPVMGAEDFAYYMKAKPGAYFFTGAAPEGEVFPHHHPRFNINEKALPLAAKLLIQIYFDYQLK